MSDDGLRGLAQEQAALRRVATLVARGAPPEEVFAAVTGEVGRLLPVDSAGMGHYETDGTLAFVASWGRAVDFAPVGSRWSAEGKNQGTLVFQTGRPARMDSYADASGPLGAAAREKDTRSSVATPVIVEGRLWGVMIAWAAGEQPLPAETEARLTSFTELLAAAIANAESRAALTRLAQEQAALSERGLAPALRGLARRSPVPVELDLRAGQLPGPVEVAAYYAVSEAVANAAKHARASAVAVELGADDAMVRLAIRDDGAGGADPARGSGLTGLGDRIEALGGTLHITSPPGAGTTLLIQIPAGHHHTRGPPEP